MPPLNLTPPIKKLIDMALAEDLGPGDITTENLISPDAAGRATVVAKEPLILAGLAVARYVFERLDPAVAFTTRFNDGDTLLPGQTAIRLAGSLAALLTAERTALNFLQRLSGIATFTREYVDLLRGQKVRLLDTRKTTPGWRALEKYAVRIGGGANHRIGLYDAVLIKDNHIVAAGGIASAVASMRSRVPGDMTIEVETASLDQVRSALEAGAHIIMLDNMDLDQIRAAVALVAGRAKLEVSGGVTLENLAALAATGIDFISCGALTHSARAVDLGMYIANTNDR